MISPSSPLFQCFKDLPDPRQDMNKKHLLLDIVAITIIGVIAGFEGWDDIERFARARESWLRQFLVLSNGIPSHDTLRRVFLMLHPKKFGQCLLNWMKILQTQTKTKLYAIDGKTFRRSGDSNGKTKAIHMVSAWAVENGLVLAQAAVKEKSNEITIIPELLEVLDLNGAFVSIDAMGCQTEIAESIVKGKGKYLLAVKGNQKSLHEQIKDFFDESERVNFADVKYDRAHFVEKGHGRIEERTCYVVQELDWLEGKERWAKLTSVIMMVSKRTVNGKTTIDRRYYISNSSEAARTISKAIRSHWSVENSLHYTLDMTFNEDSSRKRSDNSGKNFGMIRRLALSLIKQDKTEKGSIKWKRHLAAIDNAFLIRIINGKI
jgi:predicted transposase YbfD/YdcC